MEFMDVFKNESLGLLLFAIHSRIYPRIFSLPWFYPSLSFLHNTERREGAGGEGGFVYISFMSSLLYLQYKLKKYKYISHIRIQQTFESVNKVK